MLIQADTKNGKRAKIVKAIMAAGILAILSTVTVSAQPRVLTALPSGVNIHKLGLESGANISQGRCCITTNVEKQSHAEDRGSQATHVGHVSVKPSLHMSKNIISVSIRRHLLENSLMD